MVAEIKTGTLPVTHSANRQKVRIGYKNIPVQIESNFMGKSEKSKKKVAESAAGDSYESDSLTSSGKNEESKKKVAETADAVAQVAVKVAKPLPEGYVCKICSMVGDHAIYNCPLKVDKKQAAGAAARAVGEKNEVKEESCTVYLSGLPFTTTQESLKEYLDENNCTKGILQIKIVNFDDNKSKCKGIAFVKVATKAIAKYLKSKVHGHEMNGKVISCELTAKKDTVNRKPRPSDSNDGRCYRCGEKHDPSECSNQRICYRCKSTEHLSKDCPKRKI